MQDSTAKASGSNPLKQYYVAVGTLDAKLSTLHDLIRAFESAAPLSLVVCCGARDSLDAGCSAALGIDGTRVWCLHSGMSEREVDSTVQRFKAACSNPNSIAPDGTLLPSSSGVGEAAAAAAAAAGVPDLPGAAAAAALPAVRQLAGGPLPGQRGSSGGEQRPAAKPLIEVLATTDVCLKSISKELLPLNPTLLIGYDLPTRKDVYLRRVTAVLGSRASAGGRARIAVHFAAAGQLEELRQVEAVFAERPLEEMPVHVTDILAAASSAAAAGGSGSSAVAAAAAPA